MCRYHSSSCHGYRRDYSFLFLTENFVLNRTVGQAINSLHKEVLLSGLNGALLESKKTLLKQCITIPRKVTSAAALTTLGLIVLGCTSKYLTENFIRNNNLSSYVNYLGDRKKNLWHRFTTDMDTTVTLGCAGFGSIIGYGVQSLVYDYLKDTCIKVCPYTFTWEKLNNII